MFSQPVVFVDIETTGATARTSRIIEIALIRVENGIVVAEYETFLNPGGSVPRFITQLTGITDQDVQDAPYFEDVAEQIMELCEGALFVAHNVSFDYSFVKRAFDELRMPFNPRRVCTVRLSRALYPHHRGHSLEKIIQRHDIPFTNRHRAKDDAKAIHLFSQLAHAEHGTEQFQAAVAHQLKTQHLPPDFIAPSLEHIPNTFGVYTMKAEDGSILYVGKSIHLRDRVKEHFASTALREVRLSQQTHSVDFVETRSEFAALLLESKMVKERQPLFNRQLRRIKRYALLVDKTPADSEYIHLGLTYAGLSDVSQLDTIYAAYEQKGKALTRLNQIAQTFILCPKLLGLEKTKGACFSYSLGRCKGACIGKESAELYNRRVQLALQNHRLHTWPYPGPVQLQLTEEGDSVELDQWRVTAFIDPDGTRTDNEESDFTLDEYKIIRRFLREQRDHVHVVGAEPRLDNDLNNR